MGQLLAYQGAEILIAQETVPDVILYNRVRSAMLARMQDNQHFGAINFVGGRATSSINRWRMAANAPPQMGKSAIFAPQVFTPAIPASS